MTDLEMRRLAAKAAGYVLDADGDRLDQRDNGGGPMPWNPLHDDGDALRLAVKLRIDVDHGEMNDEQGTPMVIAHYRYVLKSGQVCWNTRSEQYGDDQYAATRRAIGRAAAEIGRTME